MSISMKAALIKEKSLRRKKDLTRSKSSGEAKSNGRRKSVEMRSITSNTVEGNSSSNSSSCTVSSGAGENGHDGSSVNGAGTAGRWDENNTKDKGKNKVCQNGYTNILQADMSPARSLSQPHSDAHIASPTGIMGREGDDDIADFSSGSDVESGSMQYDEGFEDFEDGVGRRVSLSLGEDDEEGEGREGAHSVFFL
jgi:hypothetical protein